MSGSGHKRDPEYKNGGFGGTISEDFCQCVHHLE